MLGTLSQLIALSSAANGVLAGQLKADSFYPGHADFKFCNSVRYVDIKRTWLGRVKEIVRYADPNAWLNSLPSREAVTVWLTFEPGSRSDWPDHQMAGLVGGGGNWELVVATTKLTEKWVARWEVTDRNCSQNRIWGVTYSLVHTAQQATPRPISDLGRATRRLQSALAATRDMARGHDFAEWADWFQRAIDCFDPKNHIAFPEYIEFVCLDSYPEPAQRIFSAAYHGWVFGGMGSWNDIYFEPASENVRYRQLSAELYMAITDAIQQASWTFGRSSDG